MKHLIVKECFESLTISDQNQTDSLTPQEADELEQFVHQNGLNSQFVKIGRREICFINYVGFIQLSSCSIEILPKLDLVGDNDRCRQILLQMIAYSGFLDVNFSELSELKQLQGSLLDIYAHLFVVKLVREIQRGTFHSYETKEENLNLLRGKIMLSRQAQNSAMARAGAWCTYDEFSENNLLNQVLKAALQMLLKSVKNLKTLQLARSCMACFTEVSAKPITVYDLDQVAFNRMNIRFQPCFNLASALLRSQVYVNSSGSSKSFGFIFRMEALYELYIGTMAREILGSMVSLQEQKYSLFQKEKSKSGVYQLKPDIVIRTPNEVLIIDTKWKFISPDYFRHGVAGGDLYQMYAYLTRYQKSTGAILLYPYYDGFDQFSAQMLESWCLEEKPEKRLRLYTVSCESLEQTRMDLERIIGENMKDLS